MNEAPIKIELNEYDITPEAEGDRFQKIELEFLPPIDTGDKRKFEIYNEIRELDKRIDAVATRVDELNSEIDSLTNHADGLDYAVAVASGILSGLIDSFFVGKWDFASAKGVTNETANQKIIEFAKEYGYKSEVREDGTIRDNLSKAVKTLEERFVVEQDDVWKGAGIGVNAKSHHLDDLAHHPTPMGLVSAIMIQYFRTALFVNREGEWHFLSVDRGPKTIIKTWAPVLLFGLTTWIVNIIEKKTLSDDNADIPKPIFDLIKAVSAVPMMVTVLKTANNWYGHLMSDRVGSKNTAGGGMGVPGLALSLMKEISLIPGIVFPSIPQNLNKLYENGIGTQKGQVNLGIFNILFEGDASSKVDSRTEGAIGRLLGKQAIPVIINEVLVRGFYFIRRLTEELKRTSDFSQINWKKVVPFGNRTIVRMLTISTATFTAVDVADAAIRSGGFNANCILRLNFVGIGRFAIALGTDIVMGVKKAKKERERMMLRNEHIMLLNAKVFYLEADMWIEAENTEQAISKTYELMRQVAEEFDDAWNEVKAGSEGRRRNAEKIREKDNDYAKALLKELKYGGRKNV